MDGCFHAYNQILSCDNVNLIAVQFNHCMISVYMRTCEDKATFVLLVFSHVLVIVKLFS